MRRMIALSGRDGNIENAPHGGLRYIRMFKGYI
jgi:hypothetical protein